MLGKCVSAAGIPAVAIAIDGVAAEEFGVVGAVSIGHGTSLTVGIYEQAAGRIKAEVVVDLEEGVVTDFMRQNARPIFTNRAARFAVAVPCRAHAYLARQDGVGDDFTGAECVVKRSVDDTAEVGVRPMCIVGFDHNVGVIPVFTIMVDDNVAQCGLSVGEIVEYFRGAMKI